MPPLPLPGGAVGMQAAPATMTSTAKATDDAVGVARKDGRPVAVQLWLVENGEAVIHKLAYAEDAKAMSPGTILGVEMFRRALDRDRVRRIDYGTGDDGYKKDWMAERHQLWQVSAYNVRTLGGLAGAARASLSALVRRVRSR